MPSGCCFISIFAASTWKSVQNVFMHIYFSDKTLTCSSVTQDAACISIKHVRNRSVDHKGSSQQPELQPWCCHGERFRDEHAPLWGRWGWNAPHRQQSSSRRIPVFSRTLNKLHAPDGLTDWVRQRALASLLFNVQQRSRFEQREERLWRKEVKKPLLWRGFSTNVSD